MGFESEPLSRVILAMIIGSVVSCACLVTLIVMSVGSPPSQIARGLLLGWVLVGVSWLAIRMGRGEPRITWWDAAWILSAWPVHVTIAIFWKQARP
jgi:hypothetical protein